MSNQYFGDDRIVHESIDISKASSRRIYPNFEASDDIVTRLRKQICECGYAASFNELHKCLRCESADEIERLREMSFSDIFFGQLKLDEIEYLQEENERLRSAITKIEQAIVEEGKMPTYHRAVMKRHRMEWGTLHNAIDKAIEALHE